MEIFSILLRINNGNTLSFKNVHLLSVSVSIQVSDACVYILSAIVFFDLNPLAPEFSFKF
jgi:hypothetical protein